MGILYLLYKNLFPVSFFIMIIFSLNALQPDFKCIYRSYKQ